MRDSRPRGYKPCNCGYISRRRSSAENAPAPCPVPVVHHGRKPICGLASTCFRSSPSSRRNVDDSDCVLAWLASHFRCFSLCLLHFGSALRRVRPTPGRSRLSIFPRTPLFECAWGRRLDPAGSPHWTEILRRPPHLRLPYRRDAFDGRIADDDAAELSGGRGRKCREAG
jgi:hypothetical protein